MATKTSVKKAEVKQTNLTPAQKAAGYSTVAGKYNAVTGQLNAPAKTSSSKSSSGGLSQADIDAGYSTIPGAYDPKTGQLKQPVDTSQPSPQTAQIQPPSQPVPYEQAIKSLQASGGSKSLIESASNTLRQKYYPEFQKAMATGTPAPVTKGEADMAIDKTLPKQEEDTTVVDQFVDEQLAPIREMFTSFFDPEEQKKSLFDYAKPFQQEIAGLDEQIIDAQTIIEGTEDDIRNEIQMAGGFGTDSQVQALALSRNKALLKNYNNLVALRESKTNQLNMMTNLAEKDRAYAMNKFDTMMGYAKFELDFRQKAKQNIIDQYNKYTPQQLLASMQGNPKALSTYKALTGMDLEAVANAPLSEKEQLDLDLKRSALLTDKAQRAKMYADIAAQEADGTVMVDQSGKVLLPQKESMKINKEITGTDAFKAITKGKDSLQFLKNFEETFNKTGATSAVWSPRQNAKLKAEYNQAILNLKEFFNLGVLNGPDEAILRGVLPDPTNRSALLSGLSLGIYKPSTSTKSGIESMKKMIESSLDERYKSLNSQYGDYSAQSVGAIRDLNRIYVEQKAKVNPNVEQLLEENPDLTEDEIISIISE